MSDFSLTDSYSLLFLSAFSSLPLHLNLRIGLTNVLRGKHSHSLYRAYTLFFVIGTIGATRVPVVNLNPIKSLEQMLPLIVFICYQLLELEVYLAGKRGIQLGSFRDFR